MSTGVKRAAAPPVPGERGAGEEETGVDPPMKGVSGSDRFNGSGPTPLTYGSSDPPEDVDMAEVAEKVSLQVVLPSGPSSSVTVDFNTPMRDLLIHLAATFKVAPTGHVLQVLDEDSGRTKDFKPSQSIGSLETSTVYIVPKHKKAEWGKVMKANKAAKTFEITNRFTINLPGGQKAVMRISPTLTLEQVFSRVCQDKSLDSRRYVLQHPHDCLAPLDLKATIADSRLTEINLIHAGAFRLPASSSIGDASRSMPDLRRGQAASSGSSASSHMASQDPASWYMPGAGETKKKRGFLSFLSKKDKKFKPHDTQYGLQTSSAASHQSASTFTLPQAPKPSTPPSQRRSSETSMPVARPKTKTVDAPNDLSIGSASSRPGGNKENTQPPPHKAGMSKKRPAPPPPQKKKSTPVPNVPETTKASMSDPVSSSALPSTSKQQPKTLSNEATPVSVKTGASDAPPGLSRFHSRNSSDSSGYHELTLSGAESPEASHIPTALKTSIDTTSIESADHPNGDSGILEVSSPGPESPSRVGLGVDEPSRAPGKEGMSVQLHQTSPTHTLERADNKPKPAPSTKRRKAPPPPPTKAKPAPVHEETIDMNSSQSGLPTRDTSFAYAVSRSEDQTSPPSSDTRDDTTKSKDPEYPSEMARFVAQMTPLNTDSPRESGDPSSNDTSLSLPESETLSDTGSVIRHGSSPHARADSKDSQSSLGSYRNSSSVDADLTPAVSASAFAGMEEIDAPIETVPPPLEFRNDDKDSEEEEITIVTEEFVYPLGPAGPDYSTGVKVSEQIEQDPTKSHSVRSEGLFRAEPVSIVQVGKDPVNQRQPEKPTVKEEFVLTVEDLSNVSLLPSKPKPAPKPALKPALKTAAKPVLTKPDPPPSEPSTVQPIGALRTDSSNRLPLSLARVSNLRLGHQTSDDSADFKSRNQSIEMRQAKSSDRSVPSIFLPTMRYNRGVEPITFSDDDRSSESSDTAQRSALKTTSGGRLGDDLSDTSSDKGGLDSRRMSSSSSGSQNPQPQLGGDVETAREELQQQYSTLQNQFVLWQQQLQNNQTLLAAHSSGGSADANDDMMKTLQAQMQMQQKMMVQLQMSMQALTMQQPQSVPVDIPDSPVIDAESTTHASASPPSYPPPPPPSEPPAAPPLPPTSPAPKMVTAKPKPKTSTHSRFERQLDPREELMISIRSFGGRGNLKTVPVKATTWVHSSN